MMEDFALSARTVRAGCFSLVSLQTGGTAQSYPRNKQDLLGEKGIQLLRGHG